MVSAAKVRAARRVRAALGLGGWESKRRYCWIPLWKEEAWGTFAEAHWKNWSRECEYAERVVGAR